MLILQAVVISGAIFGLLIDIGFVAVGWMDDRGGRHDLTLFFTTSFAAFALLYMGEEMIGLVGRLVGRLVERDDYMEEWMGLVFDLESFGNGGRDGGKRDK